MTLSLAFAAAIKPCDGPTCNWSLLVQDVTFDRAEQRGSLAFHFTMVDLLALLESAEHVFLCLCLVIMARK